MSAAEVIEQIKALSREEQQRVVEFVQRLSTTDPASAERIIRYADDESAKAAGDRVAERYPETFRRLAE